MIRCLEGKAAIVTGGTTGIGRAVALALAHDGARVVVNGRNADAAEAVVALIRGDGGEAVAAPGDVSREVDAARIVQTGIDCFGALDIVVTSAGVVRDKMLCGMDAAAWDAVIDVHLKGTFLMAREAARHWRATAKATGVQVAGRLLAMTSEAGFFGNVGQTNYAAAKGGINALILTAALELGRYGVTAHAISPRARTEMTEGLFDFDGDDRMRTAWHPANVTPLVTFLASDAGAPYTGQMWICGGGALGHFAPPVMDCHMTVPGVASAEDVADFVRRACGTSAGPALSEAARALGLSC